MRARPKQDTTVRVRVRREEQKPLRPYDQIADVIGSVAGLPPDLAATTGEQLAEFVREKAGKRK